MLINRNALYRRHTPWAKAVDLRPPAVTLHLYSALASQYPIIIFFCILRIPLDNLLLGAFILFLRINPSRWSSYIRISARRRKVSAKRYSSSSSMRSVHVQSCYNDFLISALCVAILSTRWSTSNARFVCALSPVDQSAMISCDDHFWCM